MAVFPSPKLSGRGLILVGYLADADGFYTENMGNSVRTNINDSFICLYKHTNDGKTHPGLKAFLQQIPKTGVCIEVFTQKKDTGSPVRVKAQEEILKF